MRDDFARQLARYAVDSLIEEVSLTPKPGLVDKAGSNSHHDMDWGLLVHSAQSLYPIFFAIVQCSYQQPISQEMREKIASIGREGEALMLEETKGVNTHKGAIWTLGLMTSVLASDCNTIVGKRIENAEQLLNLCGQLASYKDRNYTAAQITKGEHLRKAYQVRSAAVEASEGYPALKKVLQRSLYHRQNPALKLREWLLQLITIIDDTCIISRSDFKTLATFKDLAMTVLDMQDLDTEQAIISYQELCNYAVEKKISPGGSADLLAGLIFIEKVGLL